MFVQVHIAVAFSLVVTSGEVASPIAYCLQTLYSAILRLLIIGPCLVVNLGQQQARDPDPLTS